MKQRKKDTCNLETNTVYNVNYFKIRKIVKTIDDAVDRRSGSNNETVILSQKSCSYNKDGNLKKLNFVKA